MNQDNMITSMKYKSAAFHPMTHLVLCGDNLPLEPGRSGVAKPPGPLLIPTTAQHEMNMAVAFYQAGTIGCALRNASVHKEKYVLVVRTQNVKCVTKHVKKQTNIYGTYNKYICNADVS